MTADDQRLTSTAAGVGDEGLPNVVAPARPSWRYVLLEELGRGGMGVVHAAYDRQLGRRVALKLLPPDGGASGHARLLREAQALARLAHPNVVTVFDAGSHEDRVFVAMELVAGESLRAWLARERRGWREIVRVFIAAGRGLEAAHRAGLVHGDFKPDNVLVGDDGAVRVADFGLARLVDEDPGEALPTRTAPIGTREGGVAGTPGYVAPEVLVGARGDARADQFAFGVSLYLAFAGRLPFAGDSAARRFEAMTAAPPAPPPAAPAALRPIIARALATSPESRYPSMTALLAELGRDPARRRKQVVATAAVAALLAGAFAAARLGRSPDAVCAPAASAWNDDARRRIAAAFAATARPFAADAARATAGLLDRYAADLADGERAACLAVARRELRPPLSELRASCLARRRGGLAALIDVLGTADGGVVQNATRAAGALDDVAGCADAARLLAPLPLPRDARAAATVAEVRQELARVKAQFDAGKFAAGLPIARAAVARATSTDYRPVVGEAYLSLALLQEETGDARGAEASLREAVLAAEVGHHDEIVARAAASLAMNLGKSQVRPAEGWEWARLSLAAAERIGSPRLLEARAHFALAVLGNARGALDDAEAHGRKAVALYEAELGPDALLVANPLNTLGNISRARGRFDEAERLYRRAYDIEVRSLGPRHPDIPVYLNNLAAVLDDAGRREAATALLRQSLALLEEALGPEHPRTAAALVNLCELLRKSGELDDAVAFGRRGLAIDDKLFGAADARSGRARLKLALALAQAGSWAEAGTLATAAVAALERLSGPRIDDDLAGALRLAAEAALQSGRLDEAQALAARAERVTAERQPHDLLALGDALRVQSLVWQRRRDHPRALATAERALPLVAAAAQSPAPVGAALLALGQARLAARHAAAARAPLARAIELLAPDPHEAVNLAAARAALARAGGR